MFETFTSAEVQRITGKNQSWLASLKRQAILIPSNPVERGRGKITTWEPQDLAAALLCAAGVDPVLVHHVQRLDAWKGDPKRSKPGNKFLAFAGFPESVVYDGETITEVWPGETMPKAPAVTTIDTRMIAAMVLLASNVRYLEPEKRYAAFFESGAKDAKDGGPVFRAVAGMIDAANKTPKGMERLLAFLDIDPASDQALFVRHDVLKLGHEAEGRRLARAEKI